MDPKIASIVEENGILRFQLQNTNVSFANAIRRTLLSDIPTLVMRIVLMSRLPLKLIKILLALIMKFFATDFVVFLFIMM